MLNRFVLPTAFLFLVCLPAAPAQANHDPNEGSLALKPRIAEPMVFDLVRPLGAEKGEFEINSLFQMPLHGSDRQLHWAPEVEVAVTESLALELEAPIEGTHWSEYKFAAQGTIGTLSGGKAIHGWQSILRVDRNDRFINADLLYLHGVRWSRELSLFTMNGMRRETDGQLRGVAAVSNVTLFYNRSDHVVFGLESNLKAGGPLPDTWLLMPQTHFRVVDNINLQVGAGLESRRKSGTHAVVGWRLIREF